MPLRPTRLSAYVRINTLIFPLNIGTAWMLVHFGLEYRLATTAGYALHVALALWANHTTTYRDHGRTIDSLLWRTTLVHTCTYGLALAITMFGVEYLQQDFIIARLMAAMGAGAWAYLLDTHYTFRPRAT